MRRVFSGIQPTGVPHLGNYFGAIAQWIRLANERRVQVAGQDSTECDVPVFSIVDVHAYTASSTIYGQQLYDNILSTTASLLALGLDPKRCILFRQSDLLEHNYLDNVLDNFVSPNRLMRMTQFKDKSTSSSTTNGLLSYPVLQAADILLYGADLVPVGEDQVQHIELTRDIAHRFNAATNSQLFRKPVALLHQSQEARRIKSLRDPEKKMSKSDPDKRSFIGVIDEPDVLKDKLKKALTDNISAVFYEPQSRPGVSNLMRIQHLVTGDSFDRITEQFRDQETAQFKLHLADLLVERFAPARQEYNRLRADKPYLEEVLKLGADKAKSIASETVSKVKHLLGSFRPTDTD